MAQIEPPAMLPEEVAEDIRAMRAVKADLLVTGDRLQLSVANISASGSSAFLKRCG